MASNGSSPGADGVFPSSTFATPQRLTSQPGSPSKRQSGSTVSTRPPTSSRSHVPSLTSNAFFRPMSSQKLQAQRRAARPSNLTPKAPIVPIDDNATDQGGSVHRDSYGPSQSPGQSPVHSPGQMGAVQRSLSEDDRVHSPPSRGTETTERDRFTADTSYTTGRLVPGSLSDSVRTLHRPAEQSPKNLREDVDKNYRRHTKVSNRLSPPKKSRSSFVPTRSSPPKNHSTHFDANRLGAPKTLLSKIFTSRRGEEHYPQDQSAERSQQLPSGALPARIDGPHPKGSMRPRANNERVGRVYQYFDGNTVFCLGGRWQNARSRPMNIVTGIFVLVPIVLFFVFQASWMWHNVSPAIPITFAYLSFLCVSAFIHASVTDPGILPRNVHRFPPITDPLQPAWPTTRWVLIKSAEPGTAAMEVPVKYCRTCNIWRPPRAHHCRICNNCIEGHDHHCVWLNNCIGRRNYRFFFTFITTGTLLALYAIGTSLTQLLTQADKEDGSFGRAIRQLPGCFALLLLAIVCFLYPAALLGYHFFLISRGESTREFVQSRKFDKSERFRPYAQGSFVRNFMAVLCRPRPPSYYQFKNKYVPGDQRLRGGARSEGEGVELGDVSPSGASTEQ